VRVSAATRDRIAKLAAEMGTSMSCVIDEAIRDYEHKRFFEELNAAIERTRADPVAWAEYQAEVAIFDNALSDGLGTDDIPEYDLPEDVR
jgi:hypothetical protein